MSKAGKLRSKRVMWILLGLLTVFLIRLSARHPEVTESLYGHMVYPVVRGVFTILFSWLPFPAIALVLIFLIWRFYETAVKPLQKGNVSIKSFLTGLISTTGALLFLFYLLWGFNYSRPGLTQRMDISVAPLDSNSLAREFQQATTDLVEWAETHGQEILDASDSYNTSATKDLAHKVSATLEPLGYLTSQMPKGRLLKPKGILLRFSTAGIYIPYSGEGHVDGGMLPVQIPFTMAHELGHGFGVTDEGECNFLAYLACTSSDDAFVKYSGLLSYWRYAASEYRRVFPEEYAKVFDALPQLIRETLKAIYQNNALYPDIMPRLRNAVYDSYLKSNGVKGGLVSYSRIVIWVAAYRSLDRQQ